jgi:Integrase core domain/Tetracyclin repressor-like, C-terminal domain
MASAPSSMKASMYGSLIMSRNLSIGTWRLRTQFTSSRSIETLNQLSITHRRTAYHHPEGNSYIERFHHSLKEEEVWTAEYRSLEEARTSIARWIEEYNHDRPHRGVGNRTPHKAFLSFAVETPERIGRRLLQAGFSVRQAVVLLSTVYTFTVSFVIEEQAVFPVQRKRSPAYDLQKRNAKLDATKFPILRQGGAILFDRFEQRYKDSLTLILGGASFRKM